MVELTRDEREKFNSATQCHICKKPFVPDNTRVRDHCHLTGRYRGPAHANCNLNYRDSRTIPIVFHNLSGYDAHFIVKELASNFKGNVDVLPINKEKYISFTKHVYGFEDDKTTWRNHMQLRFIDSFKFLSSSLDKLSSYINNDKLRIVRSEFAKLSADDFDLLTRKGVFPYEYVDCAEKLEDTRLLPRESFYSSLTGDTVSESDYAHAENIWQRFTIRTLGKYSDLYLKTDVLLLADVFENFRDSCINSYGVDPAYYYTLSGFTWDAMLKHTRINFELLTDIDMVMYIERGIRGGLSQCLNRYAQAKNKYMQSYDPSKPSSYLMYYDVNNLYGWAMCQPLPYAEFRWVDDTSNFDVNVIAPDSPKGYILEVDLEYPQQLHDAHVDLPLCPTCDKPPGKRQDKLLATVYDKKRTAAKNGFEKNLYKLMNNAVFGKTMENVRNHVDVKLLTKWNGPYGAEAMIAKPNFHSRSVFSENLVAIEMRKLEVKFNKPIYVGMCILDISKQQDLYTLPHESFLYIKGKFTVQNRVDGTIPRLGNNCMAFMFDEIRYELDGVEIDRNRNVGITSTLKNYATLSPDRTLILTNAGWDIGYQRVVEGDFNFCVPLNMLLGFCEDYKRVVINARHELILIRSRNNNNCVQVDAAAQPRIDIFKIQWRMPHVLLDEVTKLSMLRTLESGRYLSMGFRSWDLYEYPLLQSTTKHSWAVKTAPQLEKLRYVIFALQTGRKNVPNEDITVFNDCKLINVKLYLNSECYPYDDMNLDFDRGRSAILYEMYSRFRNAYYGCDYDETVLTTINFLIRGPFVVIDCSRQNESVKSATVDVRLEFDCKEKLPDNTMAYCLIIHNRVVAYSPLTNVVRRIT
ncbi:hypothetical protein DMN91_005517 [Ooceraea biroi]|uniref:DNA-directed DNA polymerase n=1 Tax=Ooceraea biroi TaxID=2015173 RepID=A0A3L8DL25_OOCBI|nr:hypothetical protein DMN91_005517 [Ooceraea biroi]